MIRSRIASDFGPDRTSIMALSALKSSDEKKSKPYTCRYSDRNKAQFAAATRQNDSREKT